MDFLLKVPDAEKRKKLAQWWNNVIKSREKLDDDQRAAVGRMESHVPAKIAEAHDGWASCFSMFEAWVKNNGRLPKQHVDCAEEEKHACWMHNQRNRRGRMTDDQRARFETLESSYGYLSNAVDGGSNVSRGSASVSSQQLRDADVQRSLRVSQADVDDAKAVNEEMSAALSDSAVPPSLGSSVSRMRG